MKKINAISANATPSFDVSRRGFLKIAGAVAVSANLANCGKQETGSAQYLESKDLPPDALPSKGYLLVDAKKCQGCISCMMICSMAHEGKINLSLSRIQVQQNPFGAFPADISIALCRQCVKPQCVDACPTKALHIDAAKGNIRVVDADKCTGCRSCVEACAFEPSRAIWNFEDNHAQKCDLCENTPFWEEKGGLKGKQACISVCPVGAIAFSEKIPVQKGDRGYRVNLRGKVWAALQFPTD
jgi:protein NrfC